MKGIMLNILRFAAMMAVLPVLSGCLGTRPVIPTTYYLINPAAYDAALKDAGTAAAAPSVDIAALRLPRYLEKPQIVVRDSRNRLSMAEYHQWAGNLRKNLLRTLAGNLSFLLDTPNVTMAPFRPPAAPDARVEVEIMGFEADETGKVRLSVQWRLSGKNATASVARMSEFSGSGSSPSGTVMKMDRIVREMEMLWGEFARQLADEIRNLPQDTAGS
ncbi:MAG TPA: hypothetical protein DHV36_04930 [Desulfobacteraceae bacterium]|nr:hypothetical protein [Desulfobacteraceae bacterium]